MCTDDLSICYSLDFEGAPDKYQLVVTLEEIDFGKHVKGGTMEYAVAAQRSVETEVAGTFTIELSSEQSEERSITSSIEEVKEGSRSTTDTKGGEKSASLEGGTSIWGVEVKGTVSS